MGVRSSIFDESLWGNASSEPARLDPSALLEGLTEPQQHAVLQRGGPLLVIAGAGSGKTRVLTRRIAHILASGDARAWEIMAITFTNKAADEMKRRVVELVGEQADRMWVSTFHSACLRMLRANAEVLGYARGFTIYDAGDAE
ncbi:MAG: UvrD-helicase domain-containing protein, partial [Acidobacteria bacterium]|nr:UvrD-helicase domain-containing protein [Acidobacteriota bacterium]